MSVINVDSTNFDEIVINSDIPVLIDMWAPWCGPCRMMGPVVDELSEEIEDVKFVKLNVDEAMDIAREYNVVSIPTLLLIKGGEEINRSIGLIDRTELLSFIGK